MSAEGTNSSGKYTKRLLPQSIVSETLHGPINKSKRSPGEQAALEKRKNELLQSMTKEQIEAAYSGQAVRVNEHLTRKQKRHEDIDAQITQLKDEHDMEMRVIKANLTKQDEKRSSDAENPGTTKNGTASDQETKGSIKDDDHEEGEIGMAD